ncbi:hypothetical protein [Sphaerisporangium album]|uniref:hypothetical protein n=1 Tax=Sphaerisporangium album TaxID=509200 RepID=UPI001FE36B1F|nr:hypothetical protein [Sphaerisporangium album]
MNAGDDLSADDALAEIGRMRRSVGRSATSMGWLYLAWGVAALLYWPAIFFAPSPVPRVAALAWMALTVLSLVYACRLGVYDRARMHSRVAAVWVAAMVGVALFGLYVIPEHPSGWWVAAGLAATILAALPVLYAAWRLRPWEGAR